MNTLLVDGYFGEYIFYWENNTLPLIVLGLSLLQSSIMILRIFSLEMKPESLFQLSPALVGIAVGFIAVVQQLD